jgi:hypothetical protein
MDDTAFHRIFQCDLAHNAPHMNKRLTYWRDHPAAARGIVHIEPPKLPPANYDLQYQLFGADVTADKFVFFVAGGRPGLH